MAERRTLLQEFFGSLTARLLALLTLVLMPLGAIAVFQTSALSTQLEERAKLSLLASASAAVNERTVLFQRLFGAAEAVSAITLPLIGETETCSGEMDRLVSNFDTIIFAGLMTPDLKVACNSEDLAIDAAQTQEIVELSPKQNPFVALVKESRLTGEPVMVVAHPVWLDEAFSHYAILVAPLTAFETPFAPENNNFAPPESEVIFAADGRVLDTVTTSGAMANALPADRSLSSLAVGDGQVFEAEATSGERRLFAVFPIFRDSVFEIVSWPAEADLIGGAGAVSPWVLPITMWLATLAVAYVALNRLVVRHVRLLGVRMRRFAGRRTLPEIDEVSDQPDVFRDMNVTFRQMAEDILEDEARLEDTLREKTMLIREVHHRVKNNLQLIASIMNMQVRRNRNAESSEIIRRLQDRVLGLAAVHRRMYEADSIANIRADRLLEDITRQTLASNSRLADRAVTDFDKLSLGPDQSVPLALLAAEATANAAKYSDAPSGQDARIAIRLNRLDDDFFEFSVENSLNPDRSKPEGGKAANGLGLQLIKGFVTQLDGTLKIDETENSYRVAVAFPVKEVALEEAV